MDFRRFFFIATGIALLIGCSSGSNDGDTSSGSSGHIPTVIGDDSNLVAPGLTEVIRWTTADDQGAQVNVEASFDSGSTWVTIENNVDNTGEYIMQIPDLPGVPFQTRITTVEGEVISESSEVLIAGELTNIAVGEGVTTASTNAPIQLTWNNTENFPLNFSLLISTDGGETWEVYQSAITNVGRLSIDPPSGASSVIFQIRDDNRNVVVAQSLPISLLAPESSGLPAIALTSGGGKASTASGIKVQATIGEPMGGLNVSTDSGSIRGQVNLSGVTE